MKARANKSVYWPGMDASIRSIRANCMVCSTIAPSQPREPIILTQSPEWPFQQIVMDIFYIGDRTYLTCVDRLTGWLILYHLESGHATSTKLMSICRQLFQTYGAPEELSTDGGPPFTSSTFQEFLKTWCVRHRLSSVVYPQSNSWAELAVKTAKRIVKGNIGPLGSLDNDSVARARILQSKALAYHQHNYYSTVYYMTPFLHSPSSTSLILNGYQRCNTARKCDTTAMQK